MKVQIPCPKVAALLFLLSPCLALAETYHADPVKGSAQGDGSDKAPWKTLAEVVQTGKLAKLKGGDTLLLGSGNHGDVKISGNNDKTITIAAEPGQTPQLSRFEITQGTKWLIKGLTISSSFAATPYKGSMVTLAEGGTSSELVMEDCFIYTVLDSSKWTVQDWMSANDGIMVGRNGTNLTQRNNYILNTRFASSLCAPDSLFEGNIITNFSGDGIRVTRDGITVQYNVVKNAYVSDAQGDKNHDDLIQVFLFGKGTGTIQRETIRGNLLIGNEDPHQPFPNSPQGLGFFDGPLVDFLIEKNVIFTTHYHGISLFDAQNCKIIDNAVKGQDSGSKMKPWILLSSKPRSAGGGPPKGNVVKNNMAHSFDLKADPTVVAENNVKVTDAAFNQRLKDQEKLINSKFGEFHPVAKLSRLGMRKGEYVAPAATATENR